MSLGNKSKVLPLSLLHILGFRVIIDGKKKEGINPLFFRKYAPEYSY